MSLLRLVAIPVLFMGLLAATLATGLRPEQTAPDGAETTLAGLVARGYAVAEPVRRKGPLSVALVRAPDGAALRLVLGARGEIVGLHVADAAGVASRPVRSLAPPR